MPWDAACDAACAVMHGVQAGKAGVLDGQLKYGTAFGEHSGGELNVKGVGTYDLNGVALALDGSVTVLVTHLGPQLTATDGPERERGTQIGWQRRPGERRRKRSRRKDRVSEAQTRENLQHCALVRPTHRLPDRPRRERAQ